MTHLHRHSIDWRVVAVTLLIHVMLGWYAFRSVIGEGSPSKESERLRVVLIPNASKIPERLFAKPRPIRGGPPRRRAAISRAVNSQTNQAAPSMADAMPALSGSATLADDTWSPTTRPSAVSAQQQARLKLVSPAFKRTHPLASSKQVVAFKMKPVMSVHEFISEFARAIGFTPPGYTEDPCPALEQTMAIYESAPSERLRSVYEQASSWHGEYCR